MATSLAALVIHFCGHYSSGISYKQQLYHLLMALVINCSLYPFIGYQGDQIGRNFAIWAIFYGVGRIFNRNLWSPCWLLTATSISINLIVLWIVLLSQYDCMMIIRVLVYNIWKMVTRGL